MIATTSPIRGGSANDGLDQYLHRDIMMSRHLLAHEKSDIPEDLVCSNVVQPMVSFEAGNDFKEPTCAELIGGKNSGEGSESKGSKQTEEVDHKESGDMGKGKEAAATGFGETDK
ncbi:hypothetical protein Tco_1300798 [Tanacetum coccineum]